MVPAPVSARTAPPGSVAPAAPTPLPAPASGPGYVSTSAVGEPAPQQQIAGSNVLCVGGIRHAVGRYRIRVERLGARFEHHDGGIEDCIQGLDGRLRRADVVICQAACINHEAYHRIKRHCERTGKPCLYLERPSLAQFDRALSAWSVPPRAPVRNPLDPSPARSMS